MVQEKKMNASNFAEILREFNVAGELVRTRQEEKQGLLDEFSEECKRFVFGKISEKALAASVKKTNNELHRLDKDIRNSISRARKAGEKAMKMISAQAPIGYRATLSGIVGGEKKKKPVKKKINKKKKR